MNRKQYGACTFILIVAGIIIRLYPMLHNLPEQREKFAALSVSANLRKYLAVQLEKNRTGLDSREKRLLVNKRVQYVMQNEKARVGEMIANVKNGRARELYKAYPLGADSYYYLYLTRSIASHGAIAESFSHGMYYDPLMLAPEGHWRKCEAHPYIGFFLHRLISFTGISSSLADNVSLTPVILFICAAMLFMSLCRMLSLGPVVSLITGFFFAFSPIYIKRSCFGWYDTDPYNILFPLLALFLLGHLNRGGRKSFFFGGMLALGAAVYSLFWQGWLFLPFYIGVVFVAQAIIPAWRHRSVTFYRVHFLYWSVLFVALSAAILTPRGLLHSGRDVITIFRNFFFLSATPWPDLFIMVGELKHVPWSTLIEFTGGIVVCLLSLVGLVTLVRRRHSRPEYARLCAPIVTLYCITFLMAKSAERFVIFFAPVAAVLCGVGIAYIRQKTSEYASRLSPPRSGYAGIAARYALLLLILIPLSYGHRAAATQLPIYNKVWDNAMNVLKKETPAGSIVTSWWPPGHFIKAMAQRAVTFDGATIEDTRAYWVAAFFMAREEKEAVGIIRMLNGSGNQAVEYLTAKGFPLHQAVSLIREITARTADEAYIYARDLLSEHDTRTLLDYTHAPLPPSYCLVYNDLAQKALGLYFVSEWDFEKAAEFNKKRSRALKKGGFFWRGTRENVAAAWEISGGRVYAGKESYAVAENGMNVSFANGVMINRQTMTARIENMENKLSGVPESVFYLDNQVLAEKIQKNPTIKLSVLFLHKKDGSYSCIVADRTILTSLLYRLYYLGGTGLAHFKEIHHEEEAALATALRIYKIR